MSSPVFTLVFGVRREPPGTRREGKGRRVRRFRGEVEEDLLDGERDVTGRNGKNGKEIETRKER